MIVYDDGFLTEFFNGRVVSIEGELGAGKTLLGLEIAEVLLKEGYKLVSSTSSVWGEKLETIKDEDKVVYLVDEGGTYMRSGESVNNFSRFLRKLDSYLIIPCKKLPHEDLCELTLSPHYDLNKEFGIPLKVWVYEKVKRRKTFNGYVFQWGWQATYGTYSTIDPGDFPELIMQNIYDRTKNLFDEYGRKLCLSDVALQSKSARNRESLEVARDIQAAASEIKRQLPLLKRENTKKRR